MEKAFLDPYWVLKQINLNSYMTAADFGAGSGGWAIPLAKELEDGKVYAVDLLEEPLSSLRAKAKIAKVLNIEIVLADVEKGTKIFKNSCDLVLMTNLLFQCEDKEKIFEEAKRIMKKGAKLLVVDWKKDSFLGPKEEEKVLPEKAKELAQKYDFKLEKELEAGSYHYALLFTKD